MMMPDQQTVVAPIENGGPSSSDQANATTTMEERGRRCGWWHFGGVVEARGYGRIGLFGILLACPFSSLTSQLGVARGAIIMSNIFLSTALIRLASEEAGCNPLGTTPCDTKVYGFKPSSLVTVIASAGGLLSTFFMPLVGAILDHTRYRRLTGVSSAVLLVAIQAAQIFTLPSTWYPMAIMQVMAGFVYMVQVLAASSYLPGIAKEVGEVRMTIFSSVFNMVYFGMEAAFLVVVVAVSIGFKLDDVETARVSQAINVVWIGAAFTSGWKMLPNVESARKLPAGRSVATEGVIQIWRTIKGIYAHYGNGLGLYLVANMFAEAGVSSFTTVSVTYMLVVLRMNGSQAGLSALVILVAAVPGSKVAALVAKKGTPKISFVICLSVFSVVTLAASFVLDGNDKIPLSYVFAGLWGVAIGWYHTINTLIFSLIVPKGQESELSGFFIYCKQIIVWLPPLIFTVMNESGVSMHYGLLSLIGFFIVAIIILLLMNPWDSVIEASKSNKMMERKFTTVDISSEDGSV